MILKGIILTLILILFGLLTVAGIILTIVKWKNKKLRTIWISIGSLSLVICISTFIYLVSKAVTKTIETAVKANSAIEKVEDKFAKAFEKALDNRDYLLESKQIKLLKSYTPDSLKDQVPLSFFTYFGMRDYYRFPLAYPYSINCIDVVKYGQIYDERGDTNIIQSNNNAKQLVSGIVNFTLDKNILVAKVQDQYGNSDNVSYIIFHFDSQKTEEFSTKEELIKRTKELGFSGPRKLLTLKEYNELF